MKNHGDGMTEAKNRGIIHLIDDEKDIVTTVTSALELEGYQVHSFTIISELLKDIEQRCSANMSMLITDVRMPGGSGFEVARKVRTVRPDVPIIFMTAFEINSSEFDRVFHKLQVQEFLRKPFCTSALLEVVRKYA